MPRLDGPQWRNIQSTVRPFDTEDAEHDPEKVREFNNDVLNTRLGPPTQSTWHDYKAGDKTIATAITNHHPKGVVLSNIHVFSDHRGRGIGTEFLGELVNRYGKLHPSGHYVSQQTLDWHHKNSKMFETDPEYGGYRIVEEEEPW